MHGSEPSSLESGPVNGDGPKLNYEYLCSSTQFYNTIWIERMTVCRFW